MTQESLSATLLESLRRLREEAKREVGVFHFWDDYYLADRNLEKILSEIDAIRKTVFSDDPMADPETFSLTQPMKSFLEQFAKEQAAQKSNDELEKREVTEDIYADLVQLLMNMQENLVALEEIAFALKHRLDLFGFLIVSLPLLPAEYFDEPVAQLEKLERLQEEAARRGEDVDAFNVFYYRKPSIFPYQEERQRLRDIEEDKRHLVALVHKIKKITSYLGKFYKEYFVPRLWQGADRIKSIEEAVQIVDNCDLSIVWNPKEAFLVLSVVKRMEEKFLNNDDIRESYSDLKQRVRHILGANCCVLIFPTPIRVRGFVVAVFSCRLQDFLMLGLEEGLNKYMRLKGEAKRRLEQEAMRWESRENMGVVSIWRAYELWRPDGNRDNLFYACLPDSAVCFIFLSKKEPPLSALNKDDWQRIWASADYIGSCVLTLDHTGFFLTLFQETLHLSPSARIPRAALYAMVFMSLRHLYTCFARNKGMR